MPGKIVTTMGMLKFEYTGAVSMVEPAVTIQNLIPGGDTKISASNGNVLCGTQQLLIPPGWATMAPPPGASGPGVTIAPVTIVFTPTAVKTKGMTGGVITDDVFAIGVASGTAPAPPPVGTVPFVANFKVSFSNAGQTKVEAQ